MINNDNRPLDILLFYYTYGYVLRLIVFIGYNQTQNLPKPIFKRFVTNNSHRKNIFTDPSFRIVARDARVGPLRKSTEEVPCTLKGIIINRFLSIRKREHFKTGFQSFDVVKYKRALNKV